MDWFKKHTDTVLILGGLLSSLVWMNGKFNDLDRRLVRIETILIMKGIIPNDLARNVEEKK